MIKSGQIGLDGNDIINEDTTATKKRKISRYTGYTDAVWGAKTWGWVASTSRIDDKKWSVILHAAVERMDWSGADEGDVEEGANGGVLDPHALIEI